MSDGVKFDTKKLRYGLVDPVSYAWLVGVLTYGAAKYAPENWRKVDQGDRRYYEALIRHLEAWRAGEKLDPETGFPHVAMVFTNAMFLCATQAPSSITEIWKVTQDAIQRWAEATNRGT